MTLTRYAAFLRGINSGRNPTIRMATLREACEALGLEQVRTVLNSGNVLFGAETTDVRALEGRLERALEEVLGFFSEAHVRSLEDLRRLVAADPFQGVQTSAETQRYVTLIREAPAALTYPVVGKGYTILGCLDDVVYSIVDLSVAGSPDLMRRLDREFGQSSTTRNWNTLEKVLQAGASD